MADQIGSPSSTHLIFPASGRPGKASRKLPARRKNQIDPLELVSGDPVVHGQHGVGRYVEMTQRTVAGATGSTW